MSYISLQKQQLLDTFESQILYADLISVLVAKKGLGKSFLLEQMHARMETQVYISQVTALSELTVEQLEKSISLQLGLSWQNNNESLIEKIETTIEQRILLTIDDAHLLSNDCLEYLLNLNCIQKDKQPKNFFIVLAGEPEIVKKLSVTQAFVQNPNASVVFEVLPFELGETQKMIAEFEALSLAKVGLLFEQQKIDYFWKLSDGNPGELKNSLSRWHQETQIKEIPKTIISKQNQTPSNYKQYLLFFGYAILAFLMVLGLIFQDEINQVITPIESPVKSHKKINLKNNNLDSKSNIITKQKAKVNTIESLKSAHEDKKSDQTAVLIEKIDKQVQPKIEIKPIKVKEQEAIDVLANGKLIELSIQEKQLLELDDSAYALQWIVLSTFESAQEFKKKHPLKDNMLIFRRAYKQGYLYIIVSGAYKDRYEADSFKAEYILKGYPGKPWLKEVFLIKKDISNLR